VAVIFAKLNVFSDPAKNRVRLADIESQTFTLNAGSGQTCSVDFGPSSPDTPEPQALRPDGCVSMLIGEEPVIQVE
jgi:hypothetical protein